MSLESKIDELIAALDRATAARLGAGTAAPAPAKPAAAKPAAAKPAATPPAGKTSAPAATVAKAAAAAAQPKPAVDMKALGTLVTHIADDFLDESQQDSQGQPVNIGRPRIVALLQEFGASKLPAVPKDRLHEFATKAQALYNELSGGAQQEGGEAQESLV